MHDLAAEHPGKLQELINLWFHEAGRYNGLPLEDRTAVEVLTEERPQMSAPATATCTTRTAPRCPSRPRSTSGTAPTRSPPRSTSRLPTRWACCSPTRLQVRRHSLYVADRKLKYVYNFCGIVEQMVVSTEDVPVGQTILSAAFERDGDDMPTHGTLTLFIGDRAVGSGQIKTQPGNFSLVGEGLNVGRDGGEPVTDDYPGTAPWAFTGGAIKQVIVDVRRALHRHREGSPRNDEARSDPSGDRGAPTVKGWHPMVVSITRRGRGRRSASQGNVLVEERRQRLDVGTLERLEVPREPSPEGGVRQARTTRAGVGIGQVARALRTALLTAVTVAPSSCATSAADQRRTSRRISTAT